MRRGEKEALNPRRDEVSEGLSGKPERVSLEEHERTKSAFLEAKQELIAALNERLTAGGCGPLLMLSSQDLEAYNCATKNGRRRVTLKLVCHNTARYLQSPRFRAYAEDMDRIRSELVPAVLQSRQNLIEAFERLSEEDQVSLLPQTHIEILGRDFGPQRKVKNELAIDLRQLKEGSAAQEYLDSLPLRALHEAHAEFYNEQIRQALSIARIYLEDASSHIYRLVSAYSDCAPPEEAISFFKTQIFEQFLRICIAARDNGDQRLLKAVGQDLNPPKLLPGYVGNCFSESRTFLQGDYSLNSREYAYPDPGEGEYLLFFGEDAEAALPV